MKKAAQLTFIVIIGFFFLLVKIQPVFASESCNVVAQDCGSKCGCKGTCWYSTYNRVCVPAGCHEWDYDSLLCDCHFEGIGSSCYYDEGCLNTRCVDYGVCQDWSGASPCINCYDLACI